MRVISKQLNSKMCMICGLDNPFGVKANFYNMEDGSVATIFQFKAEHQSYPERTHGGIVGAMLDELMGRAIWIKNYEIFGVTTTMKVTYRKPVPFDVTLKARGYIINDSTRMFSAKSEIFDQNDNLLAEAEANYLKIKQEQFSTNSHLFEDEMLYINKDNIETIDFKSVIK